MAKVDYEAKDGKVYSFDTSLLDWLVVAAPAIVAKTAGSKWLLAWDGTARRSNPDSSADTTPDVFTFTPQVSVALNAIITSAAATISGISAAAPVSVSGGEWSKNGGAWGTATGTVVATDTVQVRHTSSGANSTATLTTLTIGGVAGVFTSTTVASPARVGIVYRFTGQALAGIINPEWESWPVALDAPTDGNRIQHLAQAKYGSGIAIAPSTAAQVRALTHFEIIDNAITPNKYGVRPLGSDTKWFRGTIYKATGSPKVDYSPLNGGGTGSGARNKPRVNLQAHQACQAIPLNYRQFYRLGVAYYIPTDYVTDTVAAREILLQLSAMPNNELKAKNNFEICIQGGASGNARWNVDRQCGALEAQQIANGDQNPDGLVDEHETDFVPATMLGKWIVHMFRFRIDDRTVGAGGSPYFEWVMEIIDPVTQTREGFVNVFEDSTTPFGWNASTASLGWSIQGNLPYKGQWNGASISSGGVYNGRKTDPIWFGMSSERVGDGTASYSDVHPLRLAHP